MYKFLIFFLIISNNYPSIQTKNERNHVKANVISFRIISIIINEYKLYLHAT